MWPALKGVEGCVCLWLCIRVRLFGGVRVHPLCKLMLTNVWGCVSDAVYQPGDGITVCVCCGSVCHRCWCVSVPVFPLGMSQVSNELGGCGDDSVWP